MSVQLDHSPEQPTSIDDVAPAPQVLALLAAVVVGAVAQGGYYTAGRVLVTVLVTVAVILALWTGRHPATGFWPVAAAGGVLGLWVLARAVTAGGYDLAAAAAATIGCLVGAMAVVRRLGLPDRERLASALTGVGAGLAILAWAGVAWRIPHLAVLTEGRVWRGAATVTYPNATAALLATLAIIAIAMLVSRPRSTYRLTAAYLLLVGLGATVSRAGFLALLVGLAVLTALIGVRTAATRTAPLVLGSLVAVGALAPSLPASGPPNPLVAVLGLAAGAIVALGLSLARGRTRMIAYATTILVAALALASQLGSPAMRPVLASRWTLDSYGRSMGAQAAMDLVREHPVIGGGVGQSWLSWQTSDGNVQVAQYVHDEYLQTVVDLGAIGAALLLCLLVAIIIVVHRGWTRSPASALKAGALAAIVALTVHSGLDFLWHLALLPLAAGLYLGLAGPYAQPHQKEEP